MSKKITIVVMGGVLGFLYYEFIGCTSGACPITSNPYSSIFVGILIASLIIMPNRKKK